MDFDLSEEQRALKGAARDLLAARAGTERVRAVAEDGAGYDAALWEEVVTQGWTAVEVPEPLGGLGLSFVEAAVLAEEIGRHVAPIPFLSTTLALAAVLRDGADESLIRRLGVEGGIGCLAVPGAPVIDLPVAELVVTVGDDEVRLLEIGERGAPQPTIDITRTVGWLDSGSDAGRWLGGGELAQELLDRAAALYAIEMLGAAERMLEVSVEYAKVREQFGRPIGSFQAVKHRLADALVDVEGMRSAAYYATWAVSADADDRTLAASTAKSWCAEAGRRVVDSALQVHGGIGFTWEHDLHLYLKRVHLDASAFGDAAEHRERIATELRKRVEAGADLW